MNILAMSPYTLRDHWPVFLLAFLVGFMLVFPALVAKFGYGIPFDSPANIRIDDEFFYFARIRDVLDGHFMLGNAYLWEHKDNPPAPLFFGEWLAAAPLKVLGLNPVAGGALYDFLLPPLAVLLAYACLFQITKNLVLALGGTAALFLGFFPSDFGRAISPQINFLFWLSQFLLAYKLLEHFEDLKKRRLFAGLSALNFGLLFYLYTYYWTFYLAFFAIVVLWAFWRHDRALTQPFLFVIAGGFIVALPYFWLMLRAFRLPEYGETLRRIGMIESHFPSGLAIVLAAIGLLGACLVLCRRGIIRFDRYTIFFASGALATVVSVNQHIVTGKNLEFSSHYFLLSVFWFVFFTAYLLSKIFAHQFLWQPHLAALVAVSALIIIIAGLSRLKPWLAAPSEALRGREQLRPVLNWIATHTAKDDVVYAPEGLSELIPIYTSANVYFAAPVRLFFLSEAELRDRFILNHYFEYLDQNVLLAHMREIYGVYYLDAAAHARQAERFYSLFGIKSRPSIPKPDAAVEFLLRRSVELHQKGFEPGLKHYRVDYIIWPRGSVEASVFDHSTFLKPAAEVSGFRVWRVD